MIEEATIDLHHRLQYCAHGHEVRDLSVQQTANGWLVWGHYSCGECSQVALDIFRERPHEARIAGRRLSISLEA